MFYFPENYWRKVVRKEKKGVWPLFLRMIFLPLSWLYGLCISVRNFLYRSGWIRRYHPPVDVVVSVGNIVVGGTGKTPFTLLLAKEFYSQSTLSILYRGYRSKAEKLSTPLTLCRGKGPMFSAEYCGDEAFILARSLPKAHIFVGRDRRISSRLAAECGARLVIMDDGLQHQRVVRDYDIVIVDQEDPFGQGYYLPRGFLREGVGALHRADLLVIHPVKKREDFFRQKETLKQCTSAPIIGTRMEVVAVRNEGGDAVESLEGKKVGVFCGIAQPERFTQTVEDLQAHVIAEKYLPDHVGMESDVLLAFAEQVMEKGGEALVCTEKDQVKLPEKTDLPIPIFWVEVAMEVVEGKEQWDAFLKEVASRIQ